jgi:hypothetical protein
VVGECGGGGGLVWGLGVGVWEDSSAGIFPELGSRYWWGCSRFRSDQTLFRAGDGMEFFSSLRKMFLSG